MKNCITVREYAQLTTSDIPSSLERAQVSPADFDWICRLNTGFCKNGAALLQAEGQISLCLDNYVGVIETPGGTQIEILPKTTIGTTENPEDEIKRSRRLLIRMLQANIDLPSRETQDANISLFEAPLSEWVMGKFLQELHRLVMQGLHFDYQRISGEEPFLKGQLQIVKQMRQLPHRQHLFYIRYDSFSVIRPEHRLLRLAVDVCMEKTTEAQNWRLAMILHEMLRAIPPSTDIRQDFQQWQKGRHMARYASVRPWCELVLGKEQPLSVTGTWRGLSLLFPMEKLFERYVARKLNAQSVLGVRLRTQVAERWLCTCEGRHYFQLRPDILLEYEDRQWIFDTKWKLLDRQDTLYGLKQADFYQMFAYGQQYFGGIGELALIYPKTPYFPDCPYPYQFAETLKLWILGFDLETEKLCTTPSMELHRLFM
jgi:5-methylcytosine-specific restriction enzyme subunit McrC